VGEDREDLKPEREKLWRLIEQTRKHLDWLLLTKRPQNIARLCDLPTLRRCWVGTTVENQDAANERMEHLVALDLAVRFLSVEPLLELTVLGLEGIVPKTTGRGYNPFSEYIDWVIVGGESGSGARFCDVEWVRAVVAECRYSGTPVFVKQLGAVSQQGLLQIRTRKGSESELQWPADLQGIKEFPLNRRLYYP
jgi:protein gp37